MADRAPMLKGACGLPSSLALPFLPLHVIRDQQLIEKHARSRGLPVVTEWSKLSGGASMNDALLSGSIDVGIGGLGRSWLTGFQAVPEHCGWWGATMACAAQAMLR